MKKLALAVLLTLATFAASAQTSYYRIPNDSVGKKMRTWQLTVGADTVHQQAFTIFDTTGDERGVTGSPLYVALDAALPAGSAVIGAVTQSGAWNVGITGSVAVTGTFWPTTQPVSGSLGRTWVLDPLTDSVNVGNWPSSYAVTGSLGRSWTLGSGTDTVSASVSNWPATQAVTGTFWQTTQPVSGPLTDAQLRATAVPVSGTFWQATQPVSAASLPLPSGAATESTLTGIKTGTDKIPASPATDRTTAALPFAVRLSDGSAFLDPRARSWVLSSATDTVTTVPSGTQAVSGPLTDTQLRASAVPISASALPLPSGAATESTLSTLAGRLPATFGGLGGLQVECLSGCSGSGGGGTSSVFGAAAPASGTASGLSDGTNMQAPRVFDADSGAGTEYVTGVVLRKSGAGGSTEIDPTQIRPLTSADTVTIVPSGTQTVSGTVGISGTVPVSGPLTDTQLRAAAVPVDGSGVTQPVSGTVGVSGSVAVTGPLTDTQLRATAVPVSGTFYQATQPISAAALPLPSGAATAAKQPALGTAGTASADVISVQGVASMTPIKTDGSGVTQPISGSVTANAGTNLNTSALALESGGNLAAIVTNTGHIPTSPATDRATAAAPFSMRLSDGSAFYDGAKTGQLPAALDGSGFLKIHEQGTVPVTGTFYQATQPVSGTFWQATQPVSGTFWQTTQPVSLASVPSHAVTNAGTFAVQAASAGDVASGSSDSGNPVKIGGVGKTALPTAVSDGQRVNGFYDKDGRAVTTISPRELVGVQTTQIASSSAETTIVTAIASTFCDLTSLTITNATATAVIATLKDATSGTTRAVYNLAASGGITLPFNPPMPQAAVNNNWTITLSSAAVTVSVNAVYVKAH